jgi:hypothetical protein
MIRENDLQIFFFLVYNKWLIFARYVLAAIHISSNATRACDIASADI